MKIIFGLGNPDKKYLNTFHNLGFMCLDKVAEKLNFTFSKEKFKGLIAEGNIFGEKVILVKPLTYMNLSGECVREVLDFYKADLQDILVVYDDYDLKKGDVRIRENGSAGTHNGMRNIIGLLGKENFARIRIGFKPTKETQIPLIDLVLSGIKEEDKEIFQKSLDVSSNAVCEFIKGKDLQSIMRNYNYKA